MVGVIISHYNSSVIQLDASMLDDLLRGFKVPETVSKGRGGGGGVRRAGCVSF